MITTLYFDCDPSLIFVPKVADSISKNLQYQFHMQCVSYSFKQLVAITEGTTILCRFLIIIVKGEQFTASTKRQLPMIFPISLPGRPHTSLSKFLAATDDIPEFRLTNLDFEIRRHMTESQWFKDRAHLLTNWVTNIPRLKYQIDATVNEAWAVDIDTPSIHMFNINNIAHVICLAMMRVVGFEADVYGNMLYGILRKLVPDVKDRIKIYMFMKDCCKEPGILSHLYKWKKGSQRDTIDINMMMSVDIEKELEPYGFLHSCEALAYVFEKEL